MFESIAIIISGAVLVGLMFTAYTIVCIFIAERQSTADIEKDEYDKTFETMKKFDRIEE